MNDDARAGLLPPGDSYAEWIRRTLTRARSGPRLIGLFDSSVPEPVALLSDLVARGFSAPVTPCYTSAFANGNPYVVASLADRYGVGADHILCTTGATGALSLLYRALVGPGERILVETPGFDLFHEIAVDRSIPVDMFQRVAPAFALDVDAVAAALTPATRLVVLSNLHNPSGVAVDHAAMQALAALAEARGLIVIVDEVYGDYADAAARPCPAATLSPRMISVSSLTKIYGLSTLRCGWIVGDPAVIAPVRRMAQRLEFGVSTLAHAAAALVLADPRPFRAHADDLIAKGRAIAGAYFDRWRRQGLIDGELPPAGCIAFPRLTGTCDTRGFAEALVDRTGVVVAPGEYFGAPGHLRIGFGLMADDLRQGLDALDTALIAESAFQTT